MTIKCVFRIACQDFHRRPTINWPLLFNNPEVMGTQTLGLVICICYFKFTLQLLLYKCILFQFLSLIYKNFLGGGAVLSGLSGCRSKLHKARFILPANAKRIWREFDVTTILSQRDRKWVEQSWTAANIRCNFCDVNIRFAFAFAGSMNRV